MFRQGKGSSLFPYRCHLEHMYGSDMCAFHIELFKMWPEILFIEKRNIKNLRLHSYSGNKEKLHLYRLYFCFCLFLDEVLRIFYWWHSFDD